MFGIGAQEMLIIGLLALLIFGPGKLPGMARDLGRYAQKARASVDEFKSGFALEENRNDSYGTLEEVTRRSKPSEAEWARKPGEEDQHQTEEGWKLGGTTGSFGPKEDSESGEEREPEEERHLSEHAATVRLKGSDNAFEPRRGIHYLQGESWSS